MSALPVTYAPPPWSNQDMVLYHGTIDVFVPAILSKIEVSRGRPHTDFGPGFYTTTVFRQAHTWAEQLAATRSTGGAAAVVEVTISRRNLAGLQSLAFVRGDFAAEDFWSFVHHCRGGAVDHGRAGPQPCYDIVYGPVAASWNQRLVLAEGDQISFHTDAAEVILNASPRRRII
jgi:Protein of unknown function (DUF3990)